MFVNAPRKRDHFDVNVFQDFGNFLRNKNNINGKQIFSRFFKKNEKMKKTNV